MMNGFFLHGTFCGTDEKEFRNVTSSGQTSRIAHYVLVTTGKDFYKISVDRDYKDDFVFGDHVVFKIRANSYNDKVYYSGEYFEEGEQV